MKSITKQFTLAFVAISLGVTPGNCGSAKISGQREISTTLTIKPTVVRVANFDLDATDIKSEKGVLPPPAQLPAL